MMRKSVETRDWLNTIEPRTVRAVMKRVVEDITTMDSQVGFWLYLIIFSSEVLGSTVYRNQWNTYSYNIRIAALILASFCQKICWKLCFNEEYFTLWFTIESFMLRLGRFSKKEYVKLIVQIQVGGHTPTQHPEEIWVPEENSMGRSKLTQRTLLHKNWRIFFLEESL